MLKFMLRIRHAVSMGKNVSNGTKTASAYDQECSEKHPAGTCQDGQKYWHPDPNDYANTFEFKEAEKEARRQGYQIDRRESVVACSEVIIKQS